MRLENVLLACGGMTSLAMSSPKRFEIIALKVEAGKSSENNFDFIDAGP